MGTGIRVAVLILLPPRFLEWNQDCAAVSS